MSTVGSDRHLTIITHDSDSRKYEANLDIIKIELSNEFLNDVVYSSFFAEDDEMNFIAEHTLLQQSLCYLAQALTQGKDGFDHKSYSA